MYDFRLRASNIVTLYIQGVAIEKRKEKQGTVLEVFCRRVFGGLPFFAEIFSGPLGSTKQHVGIMTEIYLYSNMFSIAVNDLFSYLKEKYTNCDNMFGAILAEEEAEEYPKLLQKLLKFARLFWSVLTKRSKNTLNDILSFVPFLIFRVDALLVGCGFIVSPSHAMQSPA